MTLLHVIKKGVLASFFVMTTFAAQANNLAGETVACPSLDKIHQGAALIDTAAEQSNGRYTAFTSKTAFVDSNLFWHILSANIKADSLDEAINLGKVQATQVSSVKNENADDAVVVHICYYQSNALPQSPSVVIAIGTLTQENGNMQIAKQFLHRKV